MAMVNIHEAKTRLSQLIAAIEAGVEAEVTIARNGRPAARLVPAHRADVSKRIGVAKGKFRVPDDFDADDELIAAMLEGRAA